MKCQIKTQNIIKPNKGADSYTPVCIIEVRAKGILGSFYYSWEQRKFDEIAHRASEIGSSLELPRVEYEDIISGTGRLNKDVSTKASTKAGIEFHDGDVLYGKLRPYLQNWLLSTFSGLAVGDFWVLQPQEVDSGFLYRLVQSRRFDEVANQSTGTKMPRADWKLVSKTEFAVPSSFDEQSKIGRYLNELDNLITLHQREENNSQLGGNIYVKLGKTDRLVLRILRSMDKGVQGRRDKKGHYG